MAVTEADLDRIAEALSAAAPGLTELRGLFPQLKWSRCDASDVSEPPIRRLSAYDLHLLDLHDHCPRLTSELALATGILLAARGPMS